MPHGGNNTFRMLSVSCAPSMFVHVYCAAFVIASIPSHFPSRKYCRCGRLYRRCRCDRIGLRAPTYIVFIMNLHARVHVNSQVCMHVHVRVPMYVYMLCPYALAWEHVSVAPASRGRRACSSVFSPVGVRWPRRRQAAPPPGTGCPSSCQSTSWSASVSSHPERARMTRTRTRKRTRTSPPGNGSLGPVHLVATGRFLLPNPWRTPSAQAILLVMHWYGDTSASSLRPCGL